MQVIQDRLNVMTRKPSHNVEADGLPTATVPAGV
jgi:hypothetical protein